MSKAVATDKAATTPARGRGTAGVSNVGLWVLQVGLALQFAGAGFLKLSSAPTMIDMFADIGVGQWLRYLVGALEVCAAAGLLVPRLSGLAALGLAGLMAGAAVTNQFVLGQSPWLPVGLLLVSAAIARGRWSQTTALAGRLHQGARR